MKASMRALEAELAATRAHLAEAEEVLQAIRCGEVDGLVVDGPLGPQVYTLKGADSPYRLLIEQMQEGAATLTVDGVVIYANCSLGSLLGTRLEKLIGAEFPSFVAAASQAQFAAMLEGDASAGVEGEIVLSAENGRVIPAYVSMKAVDIFEVVSICLIVFDLTERNLAMDTLAEANRRLVAEIEERSQAEGKILKLNSELESRLVALEQTNTELASFSYSVSHDLKAPLRAIDGYSCILKGDSRSQLSEEGQQCLAIVRRNVARMAQQIDGLLEYVALFQRRMCIEAVDMNALVLRVFQEARAAGHEHDASLKLGDLPPARCDLSMIRQVLKNLLGNAIKFTSAQTNAEIEVGGAEEDGENVYWVKDNGVGFDARYAHKLFGVSMRLHPVEEFEGQGMGLAIVKRIIDRHGGHVLAESEVGKGATFRFTLPKKVEYA
jgi:PAS domain S-box-containing protein